VDAGVQLIARLPLLAVVAMLVGCSSDDSAPKNEWRCFEGTTECWCLELTPGNDANSSDPRVPACATTWGCCVDATEGESHHCRCTTPSSGTCQDVAAAAKGTVVAHCP
jgi:hypothetical protein